MLSVILEVHTEFTGGKLVTESRDKAKSREGHLIDWYGQLNIFSQGDFLRPHRRNWTENDE